MPTIEYTHVTRRLTMLCEHCGQQFVINAVGATQGSGKWATNRAARAAERNAPGYPCSHCGLLPKRSARILGLVMTVLLFSLPTGLAFAVSTSFIFRDGLVGLKTAVTSLLPLFIVFVLYRKILPQGFDLNAPGVARWRLDRRYTGSNGVIELRSGANPSLFFLWFVAFLSLTAAIICATVTAENLTMFWPLLFLTSLFLVSLVGIRRVLYPTETTAADRVENLGMYRSRYARLSTEELEELLNHPSDLVPGAVDLIKVELDSRADVVKTTAVGQTETI